MKKMAADIANLLDTLEVKIVIGVGHDWGSGLLSRMANYHPERFSAYVFMDIGYSAPNPNFSIDEVNEMSTQTIGYPIMGYYHFFNSADVAGLMDRKPESTVSCFFPADPLSLKDNMSLTGAARRWFEEGKVGPIASWLSQEELETHHQFFAAENGGYGPGLNWYKCQMGNLNSEDDASIPEDRISIEQPTLLLTCRDDPIGVPVLQEAGTKPFVRNLKIKQVDTGHWLQLENPEKINNILMDFLEGLEVS